MAQTEWLEGTWHWNPFDWRILNLTNDSLGGWWENYDASIFDVCQYCGEIKLDCCCILTVDAR